MHRWDLWRWIHSRLPLKEGVDGFMRERQSLFSAPQGINNKSKTSPTHFIGKGNNPVNKGAVVFEPVIRASMLKHRQHFFPTLFFMLCVMSGRKRRQLKWISFWHACFSAAVPRPCLGRCPVLEWAFQVHFLTILLSATAQLQHTCGPIKMDMIQKADSVLRYQSYQSSDDVPN